jgi:hypothetical protein
MSRYRVIIGVIGGDEQPKIAQLLGREITSTGHILLTGGCRKEDSIKTTEAAQFGAASITSTGSVIRAVGVLPSNTVAWDTSSTMRDRSFARPRGFRVCTSYPTEPPRIASIWK